MKRYLWIDCDPGVDDASTILIANRSTKYEVIGISSVGGNATHDFTFKNARNLSSFCDSYAKVYPGADKPLFRKLVTAPYIHGEDGLGGIEIPESKEKVETKKAWDALYEAIIKYGEKIDIIAIGPLTNIAMALFKYPDLKTKIKKIIIMGGSTKFGNTTPAAEFNIYVDPEAAEIVFNSGIKIYMFGLDVTMKSYLTDNDFNRLNKLTSPQAKFIYDCLQISRNFCKKYNLDGVPLHDVCTFFYLEKPEIFTFENAWVSVETKGHLTRGKTVTDLYSDKKMENRNVSIAMNVNREEFAELFIKMVGKYSKSNRG